MCSALQKRWATLLVVDIYHLPGTARYFNIRGAPDRRLGTFYEDGDPRQAHRVNGLVRGRRVVLSLNGQTYQVQLDRGSRTSTERDVAAGVGPLWPDSRP